MKGKHFKYYFKSLVEMVAFVTLPLLRCIVRDVREIPVLDAWMALLTSSLISALLKTKSLAKQRLTITQNRFKKAHLGFRETVGD